MKAITQQAQALADSNKPVSLGRRAALTMGPDCRPHIGDCPRARDGRRSRAGTVREAGPLRSIYPLATAKAEFAARVLAGIAACAWLLFNSIAAGQSTDPPPLDPSVLDSDAMAPPDDLYDRWEEMENPPLEMGDAGNRVRELQATLNHRLGRRTIALKLSEPIFVGEAKGQDSELRNKLRLLITPFRNRALKIRGDWTPLDHNEIEITDFGSEGELLRKASFLRLPERPLKVDGVFGQHTQAGVALFQCENSLPVTGEVDAVTLDKLEPLLPTNPLLALMVAVVSKPFDSEADSFPLLVKTLASVAMTVLIILAALFVHQLARGVAKSTRFLARWLFTPESSPWFSAMRESEVFLRMAHFAPAAFIFIAARLVFPAPDDSKDIFPYLHTFQDWQALLSRLSLAYMSLALMLVGFAVANAIDTVCNPNRSTENPIGSIIRASKRFVGFFGTLLIVASLAGKSPFLIAGGLGAFMAVVMLVFRDYLLGLVSSIQIIANRVVQIGDWITLPKYDTDGDVKEISLTLIKVENFDKTVSTVPTSAVLTESFRNWSGMKRAGGRRIKRTILVDLHSIRVCDQDMVRRFGAVSIIADYIQKKSEVLEEYNRHRDADASALNVRRLTNIGTFRAYLHAYLREHPGISEGMTYLVRHLQTEGDGLPIEVYAFCTETDWAAYEAVQADIFDHVYAVLPEFGLRAFQHLSDSFSAPSSPEVGHAGLYAAVAEVESLVREANDALRRNRRLRPDRQLKRINDRIADLRLNGQAEVSVSGRSLALRFKDKRP